jgi:phosphomevalonate kinase
MRFVAPGKVVVLGEYAVLDGVPAIVSAVESGVACAYTPGGALETSADVGDTTFVDAALEAAEAPPGHYAFTSHLPPVTDTKPGLGGSAAATVVATFAARALRGASTDADAVFRQAYEVHHAVQGSGSGVDVAASTLGGVLRYVRGEPGIALPSVDLVVVWSGQSAKTGPRVAQYQAWGDRDAFLAASADAVARFADAPIAALRDAGDALRATSAAAGIDYETPALAEIAALATRFGGAGKPSGAGGGDCAIAVLPDDDARAGFEAACKAAGYAILSSRPAAGVRRL